MRYLWRDETRAVLAAEFVEGLGDAAHVAPGLVQMGDQKYIAGLRESADRCPGAGHPYLSHGRLRRPQALEVSGLVRPLSRDCGGDCDGKEIADLGGTTPVAQTSRCDGKHPMNVIPSKEVPQDILENSVLAHIAAAYFSVGKRLERKTQCSATRGFILATLRGGATFNQNQIAKLLGFDRTVVHRAIKAMVQEGLVSERKAKSGRAIPVQLTRQGNEYRERLIKARVAADELIKQELTSEERATLIRLLKLIAGLEL